MELTRSNPYPVLPLNPDALRQAEAQAYVEQKLQELRQADNRRIEGSDQQNVSTRKRASALFLDDTKNPNVQIVLQQSRQPAAKTLSRPEALPFGEASSAFLAQQLAQETNLELTSETTFQSVNRRSFEDASDAYTDTRNLTVSILGLQGFRERRA